MHAGITFSAIALAVIISIPLLSACTSNQSVPAVLKPPAAANVTSPRDFPDAAYEFPQALHAYETAVQIPEMLALIPCYCGCSTTLEHEHLKDCYINVDGSFDDHGVSCAICAMEVEDVWQWRQAGVSIERIRELIDEKYQAYGEPTDTAPTAGSKDVPALELPVADFSGGPRISFSEDTVDLGGVPMDIPINHAFRFENVGDAPLNIIDVFSKALEGC